MDELRDGRKDLPIFIHSELDDYGLDPYEFRIYARLSRRAWTGESMESIPRMARATGMKERKARYAIRLLYKANLIEKRHRSGLSSIITLTPKELWAPKWRLVELRREAVSNRSDNPKRQVEPVGKKPRSSVTPASGAGVDPGIRCRGTPASGAGVMGRFSRQGSPGRELPTTTTSAYVFDERVVSELQADPAFKHLDVAFVRDKMVRHCKRTGKEITVERLEAWLKYEDAPQRNRALDKKPGGHGNVRRESASERNIKQRLKTEELLRRKV